MLDLQCVVHYGCSQFVGKIEGTFLHTKQGLCSSSSNTDCFLPTRRTAPIIDADPSPDLAQAYVSVIREEHRLLNAKEREAQGDEVGVPSRVIRRWRLCSNSSRPGILKTRTKSFAVFYVLTVGKQDTKK
ncbi:unnamed protein product [Microthlaspi erraticum]|uniref:Uncharacterized protein n=1 Tax=Microthlaspi erraticum TaxID=1685480 RepID=A0A6D2I8D4_9BRAS|nr:unnamed protein product [Microthlaspi erraticum]CAA7039342.1 unnamed protein product [Microthlaspi erraticum]